jgi:SAM-dependent methyltransferase
MSQPYLLTATTEVERLRLQSRTLQPVAEALLDEIGVQPGWRCLDVACGPMGVLGPLARRAGPTGAVVGSDAEPLMLDAARAYLDEEGLPSQGAASVELMRDDAYASALPAATFDLTHVRFLFAPAGRDDELLPQLRRLTRPGGIIAAEEPDTGSWRVYPKSPAFDRLRDVVIAGFHASGGDLDAGRRLYGLFTGAGLQDVRLRAGLVALPPAHPYLRAPIQFAVSLRPRLLSFGIISESELDATIADVEEHLARPDLTGLPFTVMQVWGRNPMSL